MASTSVGTKTVVIADDTAFVRDRFRTAIENAGHKAILVKSAAELLARVRADLNQLDLVVVDLRLPHAPGVDLVRSIRKLDNGKLPILIFSGTIATAEEVKELAALGVAGYINEYSAVQHILPSLAPHQLRLSLVCVVVLTLGNLRGVRESGLLFAFPTYGFILMLYLCLGTGIVKCTVGTCPVATVPHPLPAGTGVVTVFVLLKAFASG